MAQMRIFVSHSSHDNAWCRPFADALKAVGYDVWYDETGLQGGAAWVASIQHEVENRDVFLLVLTPEAWESKWVQDELQLAIATRRRILPVLLRNTQVSGFLLTTQWITVIGEEPQAAARAAIIAIEAPPAPGRNAAPQATTETLDDLVTLCKSLARENRYTEALSACNHALTLDPNNIDVLTIKGWVLLKIKEPFKATATWARALSFAQGERLRQAVREIYEWLWRERVEDSNAATGVYLESLISQITNGMALYEILSSDGARHIYPGPHRTISSTYISQELASKVQTADVLRSALAIAHNKVRTDLVLYLAEGYYGYPPDKATSADVEGLRYYKDALLKYEKQDKSTVVEQYIERLSHWE